MGVGTEMDYSEFQGHTPGPWECEESDDPEDGFAILYGTRLHGMPGETTAAGEPLGYVGRCWAEHEEIVVGRDILPCEDECGKCEECRAVAEVRANARLMAAAPDLLGEVQRLAAMLAKVQGVATALEKCSVHAYQQSCTKPTTANGYSYACRAYIDAAERLRDIVGTAEEVESRG